MRNADARGIKRIVQKRSRPGANAGQELEKAQKCLGFYVEPSLKLSEFNVPRRFAKQTQSGFFFFFLFTIRKRGVNNTLVWTPLCSSVGILTRPGGAIVRRRFSSFLQVGAAGRTGWKRRPQPFSFGKTPVQTAAESHLSASATALDKDASSLRRPLERDGARGPGPQLGGVACGAAAFNTSERTVSSRDRREDIPLNIASLCRLPAWFQMHLIPPKYTEGFSDVDSARRGKKMVWGRYGAKVGALFCWRLTATKGLRRFGD